MAEYHTDRVAQVVGDGVAEGVKLAVPDLQLGGVLGQLLVEARVLDRDLSLVGKRLQALDVNLVEEIRL